LPSMALATPGYQSDASTAYATPAPSVSPAKPTAARAHGHFQLWGVPEWALAGIFAAIGLGWAAGNPLSDRAWQHLQLWVIGELMALVLVPQLIWIFRVDPPDVPGTTPTPRWLRVTLTGLFGGAIFGMGLLGTLLVFGWPFILAKGLPYAFKRPDWRIWQRVTVGSVLQGGVLLGLFVCFMIAGAVTTTPLLDLSTPLGSVVFGVIYFTVAGTVAAVETRALA
jgi:hypothetical protein